LVFFFGEAVGFVEGGYKISYYTDTLHIKSGFNKNLHVIWPGEQFKAGPSFLKHPDYIIYSRIVDYIYMYIIFLSKVEMH